MVEVLTVDIVEAPVMFRGDMWNIERSIKHNKLQKRRFIDYAL